MVGGQSMKGASKWLAALLWPKARPVSDHQRARNLIDAIDAGGIPLDAARVNAIARSLGLEVSGRAALTDTIARIRAALSRLER